MMTHFQSLFAVVVLLIWLAVVWGDVSNKTVPFQGMRLEATSQSIFWLQERLQAPGSVDFGNLTFSVIPQLDEQDDNNGERQIMADGLEKEDYSGGTRRKTRKRDQDKQKTIVYVSPDAVVDKEAKPQPPPSAEQQSPQQVIEVVLVPIPKRCGAKRLWDTMKSPTGASTTGSKQLQPTCDWPKLGIGVTTIQSTASAGTSRHQFCCSQASMDKGICNANQLGRLILHPKAQENYVQVVVPTSSSASFSWPHDDSVFATNQTGDYVWILANCWEDGSGVSVDGTLVWNNAVVANGTAGGLGNLVHSIKEGPQSKKPKFPQDGRFQIWVYGVMGALYLMLGIVWCCGGGTTSLQIHTTKTTDDLGITSRHILPSVIFVTSIHLCLSSVDLYVWGARSGSLDWWVWDGAERNEVLRHVAFLLGAFKAGMTRWLVLVQILLLPFSSPHNDDQRIAQWRTRWWVSMLAIMYTGVCMAWGILAAMAKDNIQNMKMLMDGEEKQLLQGTAILSVAGIFLDGWAYLWGLYRYLQRCCTSQLFRHQSNTISSSVILVLVTACWIFVIYSMADSLRKGHKMDALFVWDHGAVRFVTEMTYFLVLVASFLQIARTKWLSLPPDNTMNMDDEARTCDRTSDGEASTELEMAPLIT